MVQNTFHSTDDIYVYFSNNRPHRRSDTLKALYRDTKQDIKKKNGMIKPTFLKHAMPKIYQSLLYSMFF